jgi:hypothetical protein
VGRTRTDDPSTPSPRRARLERLLQRLAEDLRDRGKIDLSEAFVDATFASAEKGALRSVQHAVAKAPRSWRSATAAVFLIGDRGYDSDGLDNLLMTQYGTRWERHVENYLGMVQLACARILLRASIR